MYNHYNFLTVNPLRMCFTRLNITKHASLKRYRYTHDASGEPKRGDTIAVLVLVQLGRWIPKIIEKSMESCLG